MKYKSFLFDVYKKPEDKLLNAIDISSFPSSVTQQESTNGLEDVTDGTRIMNETFGVNKAEIVKNYIDLELANTAYGKIKGKIWGNSVSNLESAVEELNNKRIFTVSGKWNEYPKNSGYMSVIIDDFSPTEASAEELWPSIEESPDDLTKELLYYVSKMSDNYRDLVLDMLKEVWSEFSIKPAAKGNHHHKLGGLLQHTTEILRIADQLLDMEYEELESSLDYIERLCQRIKKKDFKAHRESGMDKRFFSPFLEQENHLDKFNNQLLTFLNNGDKPDRDVVFFSIIFHDIGKIMEYTHFGDNKEKYQLFFPGFDFETTEPSIGVGMDTNGVKLGHITLGMLYISRKLQEYETRDGSFLLNVLGCISSHHGRKDWGSPTTPANANETMVHLCDYIDAKFAMEY